MLKKGFLNRSRVGLIKNTAVYVFSDAINKAIPFLILPVIVRFLTPEDYGVITNFSVLIQIVSVFVISAAQGSIPVNFFKMTKEEFEVYVTNIFSIAFVVSAAFGVGFFLFNSFFSEILGIGQPYLQIALIEVFFSAFVCVNMGILRCEEKPAMFGIFQISQTFLNVALTLILVVLLKWAWEGKVLAGFVASVFMGLISIFILIKKKYYRFRLDFSQTRLVLVFALPLVPHALALWGKAGIDKVLITNISGLSENGLYSTAFTWGAIITMIVTAFSNAFSPYLMKKLAYFDNTISSDNHLKEKCRLVKLSYMFVAGMAVLVFISYFLFYWLIILIYPESYHPATRFLPWILLGEFFRGWYLIYIVYVHYAYKTKILGALTFSLSVLQVGLSYVLLQQFGTIGAAISTSIISLLTTIGVGIYASRVYPMPWLLSYSNYGKYKI